MPLVAVGAVVAMLFVGILVAGIVFFIPTRDGVIRVESDDPELTFKVDDKGDYTLIGKTIYRRI